LLCGIWLGFHVFKNWSGSKPDDRIVTAFDPEARDELSLMIFWSVLDSVYGWSCDDDVELLKLTAPKIGGASITSSSMQVHPAAYGKTFSSSLHQQRMVALETRRASPYSCMYTCATSHH
jgi:hypothetical protein